MLKNLGLLAATVLFATPVLGQTAATLTTAHTGKLQADYGRLPLSFEANQGQADPQVRFTSRGNGYSLFLTDSAAVLSLSHEEAENGTRTHGTRTQADFVRMEFAGANPAMHVSGDSPLPGKANYFLGNDPAKWHTDVPTYAKVRYAGVYPGVDLVYYGNQRQLEYDFIVAPGADPKAIKLHFGGADKLRLTPEGDLSVIAAHGTVAFHKPVVYQIIDGKRLPVNGTFALSAENTVGFRLGTYDRSSPVVIDPTLAYSTYFGYGPNVTAMAVDSGGEACVTGNTGTTLPPTPGAYEYNRSNNAYYTAYVSCLNAGGTQLAYSTYFGGTGGDWATGIAVDAVGSVYIAGYTNSTDLPQGSTSYAANKPSSAQFYSGFVAKLASRGTALSWSSYLGGTGSDKISGIAVDSAQQVFVTGTTTSKDFPTKNAPESTYKQYINTTGFAAAFSVSGSSLLYSTYLSGSSYDYPNAIAVDASSNAYITGFTGSADFPTAGTPFQKTKLAGQAAFIVKIPVTGNAFTYSTFLSGTSTATANAIALDSAGDAVIGGSLLGSDFPVSPTAFQKTNNTFSNSQTTGFVAELNAVGSKLLYATYLGGESSGDQVSAVAVDGAGKAYLTGKTYSTKFPVTTDALYSSKRSGANDVGFVTVLSSDGSSALYSTYFGGSSEDQPNSIALDSAGSIYFAGHTSSYDYPVTQGAYTYNPVPTTSGSISSSFITKFGVVAASAAVPTFTPAAGTYTTAQSVTIADSTAGATIYYTTDGSTPTTSSKTYTGAISVSATVTINAVAVAAGYSNSAVASATYTISLPAAATPTFTPAGGIYSSAQSVTIADATSGASIYYTTDGSTPTASSAKYSGAITVSSNETIQAVAVATGYTNSAVASATYTINIVLPTAATPTFSPSPGTYAAAQSVTISDSTSGATIYYTTNGTIPSASSTKYTGAVTVSATETLSAIAIASGYANSPVASGVYTIATAAPDFSIVLSSSALNVSLGKSGTETLTLTSQGGFASAVTFSCSGLPTGASCSFSPASLTPSGASSTDTLTVTAPTTLVRSDRPMPLWPAGGSVVLAACYLLRMRHRRELKWLAMVVGALALCTSLTGCSLFGSSKSSGSSGNSSTSIVTVTATSASLQHSTTFSLTVQ